MPHQPGHLLRVAGKLQPFHPTQEDQGAFHAGEEVGVGQYPHHPFPFLEDQVVDAPLHHGRQGLVKGGVRGEGEEGAGGHLPHGGGGGAALGQDPVPQVPVREDAQGLSLHQEAGNPFLGHLPGGLLHRGRGGDEKGRTAYKPPHGDEEVGPKPLEPGPLP